MNEPLSILSTKTLDPSARDWASHQGWTVEEMDFIQTAPMADIDIKSVDSIGPEDLVVFTSQNAVIHLPRTGADWRIACLSGKTQRAVKEKLPHSPVLFTADNAQDLAHKIIAHKPKGQVYFLCAQAPRPELPEILRKNSIELSIHPIYHTTATPRQISKDYDGILFYSDSGVESFFSLNHPAARSIYAAIGQTTGAALQQHTKHVIISEAPTQEALLRCVQTYYENNSKA